MTQTQALRAAEWSYLFVAAMFIAVLGKLGETDGGARTVQCRLKISFRKLCRVSHNWLLGTDTQQHEAAARHLLRAGQRQR